VTAPASVANNQIVMTLNGMKVASSARIVAPDPASHVNTTYVPVWYVMQVLKRLSFESDWNGQTWSMVDLQPLADAILNTQAASPQQNVMNLDMLIHMNLTSAGVQQMGNDPSQTTDHVTTSATIESGTVNGEKAMYMQLVTHDSQDPSQTQTNDIYVQGQHVYQNQGSGWVDKSSDPNAQQLLAASTPNVDVDLQALSNVTVTPTADGIVYQGTLNLSSTTDLVDRMLSALAGQNAMPTQVQTFLNAVLKRTTGTASYTISNTQGDAKVLSENVSLDMNVPASAFPASSDNQDMQKYISSFDLTESLTVSNTFQNTPLTPPSGLPGQTSGTNTAG